MSRLVTAIESQVACPAGLPVTTTANGYIGAVVAGAASNYKLRRCKVGVRGPAGSVTSDQHTIALYRQTARAAGTGLANTVGQNIDSLGIADPTGGVDSTTGSTFGTNGPTLGGVVLDKITLNTQSFADVPWDLIEDFFCPQGVANGLAFVNIGNALPASHLFVITPTWEV